MSSTRHLRRVIIIILIPGLLVIYWLANPGTVEFFPKCPFLLATGLKCPGCGSQRAIHHLLNLEFIAAMRNNFLLVISIPYLITAGVINIYKNPSERILALRKRLMGEKAIYIILAIIILYWILRNVFGF